MHIWCARCKRIQEARILHRRRGRAMPALAGRIGTCAVCGYPVSAIGRAEDFARRITPTTALDAAARRAAQGVPRATHAVGVG